MVDVDDDVVVVVRGIQPWPSRSRAYCCSYCPEKAWTGTHIPQGITTIGAVVVVVVGVLLPLAEPVLRDEEAAILIIMDDDSVLVSAATRCRCRCSLTTVLLLPPSERGDGGSNVDVVVVVVVGHNTRGTPERTVTRNQTVSPLLSPSPTGT